ncbi:MAG: GNAT family N-acetyltransferase [Ahrensia sp.]|nr:GNAT family N-acetyltransferase [Ahrensia sp.]
MTLSVLDIPVIETDRLILRGWREGDVPAIRELVMNEEATRFIGGTSKYWQPFRTLCMFIGHWHFRGFSFFAVEEKASGECIGWCGPWKPDGWPDNELGYALRKSSWGKGYATEAAKASLRFAYGSLGWTTAISCIDADNHGSQGVAKHLGATLEAKDVEVTDFRCDVWRHLPPQQFMEQFA